jgi:hypothetical protein
LAAMMLLQLMSMPAGVQQYHPLTSGANRRVADLPPAREAGRADGAPAPTRKRRLLQAGAHREGMAAVGHTLDATVILTPPCSL